MDNFDPEDEEENVPDHLRQKWEDEETLKELDESSYMHCEHCGKMIAKDTFVCIYCGERVFHESGLIGRLGKWLKDGNVVWIVLLICLSMLAMFWFF